MANHTIHKLALAALAVSGSLAFGRVGVGSAQAWDIVNSGPMRIPSLEDLSRPQTPRVGITPPQDGAAGPLTPFLNDSTLRSGDIVVTPDGALTYRGRGSFNHRREDFSPLDMPEAAPQPNRRR
ncbi:MAG: hypothetical protein Q8M31_15775 [Beijerinckiaceae bacterium]|nr:hypothetical protein [Beijerinckiaceae bacterium]